MEELHGPLGHSLLPNMPVLTGLGLVDVLALQDQGERLRGTRVALRVVKRLFVRSERVEVVAAVFDIRRSPLRMTPNPVLEDCVPNVPAASEDRSRKRSNAIGGSARLLGCARLRRSTPSTKASKGNRPFASAVNRTGSASRSSPRRCPAPVGMRPGRTRPLVGASSSRRSEKR